MNTSRRRGSTRRLGFALLLSSAAAATPALAQEAASPPASQPAASQAASLEEVIVTGRKFRSDTSISSTKLEERIAETPQSISVLDGKLLKDLALPDYTQALNYVPGAQNSGGWGSQLNLVSRGFFIGNANSFRLNGATLGQGRIIDDIAIGRLEVVKGGAGTTFGEGSPGGFVNLITPRPTDTFQFGGRAQVGDFAFRRAQVYASGPLVPGGRVRGYLAASDQEGHTYSQGERQRTRAVYGAVDVDITDRLTFKFSGYADDYGITDFNDNYPVQVTGDASDNITNIRFPSNLPINATTGAQWNADKDATSFVQAELNYRVNRALLLTAISGYTYASQRLPILDMCCEVTPAGDTDANTSFSGVNISSFYAELRASGGATFGRLDVQYLGSLEHRRRTFDTFYSDYDFAEPYNIYAPDHSYPNPFTGSYRDYITTYNRQAVDVDSVSGTAILKYADKTSITFGVRHDTYDPSRRDYSGFKDVLLDDATIKGSATSIRAAVLREIIPNWRAYYSYNESFEISFGRSCTNAPQPPSTGRIHEIGLKGEVLDRKLLVTAAAYDIALENDLVQVPQSDCPSVVFPTKTGNGKTSRGVELEATGKLAPTWSIIAGYAYTDAKLRGDPGQPDTPAPSIPPHQLSLFTVYDVAEGPLRGFGLGGGFTYMSRRLGTFGKPLYLGDQFRADLALYYRPTKALSFALNARNVLDSKDVVAGLVSSDFQNRYLEPRTILFSVNADF